MTTPATVPSGVQRSATGVPVEVFRQEHPGCPHGSQQVGVRYGTGRGAAGVVWYPDSATCTERIERVLRHFMADRDNIGRQRTKRPKKES